MTSLEEGMSSDPALAALTLDDENAVATWCSRYDITVDQLTLATTLVGLMPAALHFYLTSHGRPTQVVTAEMRASRTPIRPRDRRRKSILAPVPVKTAQETVTDAKTLGLERSMRELNVRIAADALHEHPCPATIRAYNDSQALLEATLAKLDVAEDSHGVATPGFTLKGGMA